MAESIEIPTFYIQCPVSEPKSKKTMYIYNTHIYQFNYIYVAPYRGKKTGVQFGHTAKTLKFQHIDRPHYTFGHCADS